MPAVIKMTLDNGNPTMRQLAAFSYKASLDAIPKSPAQLNAPLSSSMISRIHNAKSGCGSCGRK